MDKMEKFFRYVTKKTLKFKEKIYHITIRPAMCGTECWEIKSQQLRLMLQR